MAEMTARTPRWCVFLDRDGTLNSHVTRDGRRGSPRTAQEWRWEPGAPTCLRALHQAGAHLVVVTNQPDLARGLLDHRALSALHALLPDMAAVYVCPHTAADRCRCRKPSSHWLRQAAARQGIHLKDSFLIGDRPTDAQCALNAGARAVLITGRNTDSTADGLDYATDLPAAVRTVLRHRAHQVATGYRERHPGAPRRESQTWQ
ncbi:D-glycero-alpha-D-manno-heptose-1,7-bisphosphate 7-phosphatase [Streptomyces sp. NPDC056161]|uniref:D-glycero-alpha-D-manno-heptose-1,7-bisphosphate 7-phosphatase n=1 Tax=Streptomyces sp. NPDC056161 TaxID=3345732 RepID=UPI0035DB1427